MTAHHLLTDELFMHRCLELARLGEGCTAPNPMVGSVIVHNHKIIGEGYHQKYGGPHAEVNAIGTVSNESLLNKSTLYVNLEPCAHYGKTPPCSTLIIEKNIPRVVVGCIDPFSEVSGKGIAMMRDAGIKVTINILEQESRELNRRFFTFHQKKRPYIILKWAQTADGFIDIERSSENYGQPTWITNELARIQVHKMRTQEAAIIVGTSTAQKDNPSLTARAWTGAQPLRIVIDRKLRLNSNLYLFNQQTPTLTFTGRQAASKKNLEYCTIDFEKNIIPQILEELYHRNIQSLIVEGGQQLLESFIVQHFWDEAHVYIGDCFFHKGVPAPSFTGQLLSEQSIDNSRLLIYRNN